MAGFVTPPPLERGDQVAVVAPAGGHGLAYPDVYELGLERLREFDLDPVAFPTASKDGEYLYEHPEARAEDLERAFGDPDIGAIVAAIGGNDQIRIVDHLDRAVFRANPTRFFGISDNTVFHAVLSAEGIVSFYGGNLLTDFAGPDGLHAYSRDHFNQAFFDEPGFELRAAPEFTDDNPDWGRNDYANCDREWEPNSGWEWRGGDDRGTGRVWGGCLEVLDLLLAADRFVPTPDEALVLLIETSEELPSTAYVQRMLLGLGERGLLGQAAAILVGRPMARSHRIERPADERREYRRRQYDAVETIVGEYNPDAAVVCGLDFGHTAPTAVPPLGVQAIVNPETETITFG